jgi:hypothetical protein
MSRFTTSDDVIRLFGSFSNISLIIQKKFPVSIRKQKFAFDRNYIDIHNFCNISLNLPGRLAGSFVRKLI